jgi:predicted RNA binding protein with dsRBD fold (UPF0201 family)
MQRFWLEAGAVAGIAPTSDDGRVTRALFNLFPTLLCTHFEFNIISCSKGVFDALKDSDVV